MKKVFIICFVCVLGLMYCLNEPQKVGRTMGTTRDHEFQREYEEAVREYDLTHPSLPPGLVLPSGETIQAHIDSGRVYGK